MTRRVAIIMLLIVLLLAACSSSPAAPSGPAGDAANGKAIFNKTTIGKSSLPGCATCHSIEKDKKIVGPSLAGIATDAATAFKASDYKGTAKSASEWLRESIVNPNADVAEGFQPNIMPQTLGKDLTEQEIADLVAYLSTLK